MTQYDLFYRRAMELICSGEAFDPTLEQVMQSEYPATDYSNRAISNAERAIVDAKQAHYTAALRAHPHWHEVLHSGASAQECLRVWMDEGGNHFAKELLNKTSGSGKKRGKRYFPPS